MHGSGRGLNVALGDGHASGGDIYRINRFREGIGAGAMAMVPLPEKYIKDVLRLMVNQSGKLVG